MSQGVMQIKSKVFVVAVVFAVFLLFAFFFGVLPIRFVSMLRPNLMAVSSVGDNDVMSATPILTGVISVVDKVHVNVASV